MQTSRSHQESTSRRKGFFRTLSTSTITFTPRASLPESTLPTQRPTPLPTISDSAADESQSESARYFIPLGRQQDLLQLQTSDSSPVSRLYCRQSASESESSVTSIEHCSSTRERTFAVPAEMTSHSSQQYHWKKDMASDERMPQILNGGSASATTSSNSFTLNGGGMGNATVHGYVGYSNTAVSVCCGQTIEEQIKHVDRIIKDCDVTRKQLELINRRLDDLNDEVRRYREFLGHEKSRRDPALYKTASSSGDHPSAYNENICGTIGTLTSQLAMEWGDKLRSIQTQSILSKHSAERN